MKPYDSNRWYWIVGGDASQVFSSAAGSYVPVADAAYVAWLEDGSLPTQIDTMENLGEVLAVAKAPVPVDSAAKNAYIEAQAKRIETIVFRMLFNHENRIRELAGQQPVTQQQFINFVKSLL